MDIVCRNKDKWISSRDLELNTGFWRQSINNSIRILEGEKRILVEKRKIRNYTMNYIKYRDDNNGKAEVETL